MVFDIDFLEFLLWLDEYLRDDMLRKYVMLLIFDFEVVVVLEVWDDLGGIV